MSIIDGHEADRLYEVDRAAEAWLAARQEAIRVLASGEPAEDAVSALGEAEHRLAAAVRAGKP